jgi:small subunit ribosomal protein S16
MIVIRLARGGSKKQPFYRLVATEKSSPRDGRFIEKLGYYNPQPQGNDVELLIDLQRVEHWVSHGAQLSDTAKSLVKKARKAQNQEKEVA